MGDRTNPIKFGPEWLRNLAREPSSPGVNTGPGRAREPSNPGGNTGPGRAREPSNPGGNMGPGRDGASSGPPGAGAPGGGGQPPQRPANSNHTCNAPLQNTSKVLLARLRYGREEMLALYDRQTAEAPAQLKAMETLYQGRGKPPFALNNTYEDDTRDNMRGPPPIGGLPPGDRYASSGRGRSMSMGDARGRALNPGDSRARVRVYYRQTSAGRGNPSWHGNPRNPQYTGMLEDDPNQPLRPWSTTNTPGPSVLRPTNMEQQDWQNKQQQYRNKRPTNTNWRQQQSREDGEEWRSAADGARRPQEKWEWDWPETRGRPNQEKWHSNRRTWGGENSEDALPEWAVDNTEACGGTFDSSGAFHGYSNDDTNLPKNQEPAYALTRSHTHGSFVRSKTVEEGSEEWWASEKAKKLSPKRFDASEIKFKKPGQGNAEEKPNANSAGVVTSAANGQNTGAIPKNYRMTGSDKSSKDSKPGKKSGSKDKDDDGLENKRTQSIAAEHEDNKYQEDTSKEKTFERADSAEKSNEEKSNFQSVILTSNNSLRQKHQNFVGSPTDSPKRQPVQANIMQFFESASQARQFENDDDNQKEKENIKLVDDILQMSLDDAIPSATMNQLLTNHSSSALNSLAQLPNPSNQMRMPNPGQGLNAQNAQNMMPSQGMQASGIQSSMMHPIGITNSMLNASLGLPLPLSSSGMPLQGMPQPLSISVLSNQSMLASSLQVMGGGIMQPTSLQPGAGMQLPGLQGNTIQHGGSLQPNMQASGMQNNAMQAGGPRLPGFPSANSVIPGMGNSSLFNNMQNANIMPSHGGQNMFPMHELQQPSSQSFNNSLYGNMMSQPPPPLPNIAMQHITLDEWFYEDPNKTIQGPFSSKEMFNWYRAGFFSPSLMVSRGCDRVMRPLGSYGHMPFGQMDLLPPFPMGGGFEVRHQQDNMLNQQPGLGIDVESLWGQPNNNAAAPNDLMWTQAMNPRTENRVNNLSMFFWDNQPNMPATPLLPEEMKTEDEILAQMRAAQAPKPPSPLSFLAELPASTAEEGFSAPSASLDMDQLQKIIHNEANAPAVLDANDGVQQKLDKAAKSDQVTPEVAFAKPRTKTPDPRPAKEVAKVENKTTKPKDNSTKPKSKNKAKDEKKDESAESKTKDEELPKAEKRSAEPSPSPKIKKEDKSNKKDLEKEKKEWIKEGFTIVKGTDKSKDNKKKSEEAKAIDEAERKRKEEEKLASEEKKRQFETSKKQQEAQSQQQQPAAQRPAAETISKKAPWSASSQELQSSTWDGPTLAEIQRLEREKKLEQMKEQHQMMQLIAQQQATSLAREQEMQGGLGWAKKPTNITPNQSLAEIQAEARAQAAAAQAAQAATVAREEAQATPPPVTIVPWGHSTQNGGAGFWDCPPVEQVKPAVKPAEPPKQPEPKSKKKVTVMMPPKPENTPSVEFDMWCSNMLDSWRDSSIDIPTFVAFLRDIESPYEVRDYVKCYLGESREASEFAGQFLERRSRMLRVGMVTPSDDLCSPAVAINPRTNSGSDYTEVKGKTKKTKKNKMLKVDARAILGFSVTASEDRINVGDIDTV